MDAQTTQAAANTQGELLAIPLTSRLCERPAGCLLQSSQHTQKTRVLVLLLRRRREVDFRIIFPSQPTVCVVILTAVSVVVVVRLCTDVIEEECDHAFVRSLGW